VKLELNSLSTVAACHTQETLVVNVSKRTQNTSLQHSCFRRLCSDAFKMWWDF